MDSRSQGCVKTGRATGGGADAGDSGNTGGETADGDSGSRRPDVPSSQLVRRTGAQFIRRTQSAGAHDYSTSNVHSALILISSMYGVGKHSSPVSASMLNAK